MLRPHGAKTHFPVFKVPVPFEASAIDANGSNIIITKKNGKYICGLNSDPALNALEWVRKMYQTGCVVVSGNDFDNGTAVFALKTSEKAINTKCSTVHWVPFPTGPDATDATKNTGGVFRLPRKGTSIFKHGNDSQRDEDAAYILDKLFAPTEEWGKTGYDDYMARNFFDTVDDYNVYKNTSINMSYQYALEILADEEIRQRVSERYQRRCCGFFHRFDQKPTFLACYRDERTDLQADERGKIRGIEYENNAFSLLFRRKGKDAFRTRKDEPFPV